MLPLPLLLLSSAHAAWGSLPLVDFDRMGKVGLAGAFSGLDLFQNDSFTFDSSTSTLLTRTSNGSLSPLASTNSGGRILAGCTLDNSFYLAGSFSSIGSTSASNIAAYTTSSNEFSALGSNGPNGEIDAVFCDVKNKKVWVGGSFTSPGAAVAVWDTSSNSWSKPPFNGLTGAEGRVLSITSNSSGSSLFFAGSFITSFQGNGTVLNGTNNPNVPFSPGASPFSSSLVPIPLQGAQIVGSPSSTDAQFSNVTNILCPSGSDGPGNTWFAGDGNQAVITVRDFSFLQASGVRLGNTFQSNHGTTGFSVTTIPDNTVQTLRYLDPTTQQNNTCSTTCPLSTDSSVLYQDFLFDSPLSITGIAVTLSEWTGDGPGLHILQLLSSGAFASAIDTNNAQSCFAPNPSNTTRTGDWEVKVAQTNISGTTQSVLVSDVAVGTSASASPSLTWQPYVSASGNYDVNMLVPGCTNFQDCAARTTVQVTIFPGNELDPTVINVDQTNTEDASVPIYNGPILPTTPDFVTTITMTLAANAAGSGSNGQYEIVADRIELVLTSANATASSNSSSSTSGSSSGSNEGFGFFEWPLSSTSSVDATSTLANSTETSTDQAAIGLFNGIGGNGTISSENAAIASVAHHSSGTIFLAGNFTTSSNSNNIVSFKDGSVSALPENGLDGSVTTLALDGDNLFVGGSFMDTSSASTNGLLKGVALFNVQSQKWSALGAGVNGKVSSLAVSSGQLFVAGNFTQLFTSSSEDAGFDAPGFAVWNISNSVWINSGGFVVGSMTFVTNETSPQYIAGNVITSESFGASGMVMVQNSGSDVPTVTPLGVQLDGSVTSTSLSSTRRRSVVPRTSWISHVRLSHLFSKRQTSSSSLAVLPDPLSATAPAVLAGAFWTNSSSNNEVAIIGGNFSFLPSGASFGSVQAASLGIYDQTSATITALQGNQINGTVRSLLVDGDTLYVGGQFTISGLNVNGFAIYDLMKQQWDVSGVQALQPSSGSSVVVRSITTSTSKTNTVVVAGTFAQAGSLTCHAICSLDTSSNQWNSLGSGINGEVSSVTYAGNNQETLIAGGSIALSDGTEANVAQLSFSNMTWAAVGSGSDIPGPVTALEVNNANASSIFAAGKTSDNTTFLSFFDGQNWTTLASTLQKDTVISQLAMVPLQDTHAGNNIIESDRMLMISGSLDDSSFGNASTALFDGASFVPYFVSSTISGTAGSVSSLFHSFATFSFTQQHFLATGVVILISIAISAGVVFLLALIGILWTLFARRDRDDKAKQFDAAAEDDDSIHHRPSSLLEHINAATRGTIIGASPFAQQNSEKEEERLEGDGMEPEYTHDGDNYVRAETPSAYGGAMGTEEASRPAHARYSFDGAGEGELALTAGAEVEILDDRDHAWWYARDVRTGQEGVVPAAYLY
ncbi:cortical protein marker for cell polarity-domain-containing protein [Lentinula aciculospora]|uniref:Cortical protein marker for cell polarity-domain-containing protein n=1 Tax=Lentinula aciculospora TaxID=153920 RepID=A0A9W8ZVQ5_9AGAR|nr:cortical protein marker for cell polarity-domain-containing protein [Lentinula aciculospora]